MTKYAHIASNFLLESTQPGQRIIKTSMGDFKIRKNGRRILVIDLGKENEEILRVTPVETKTPNLSVEPLCEQKIITNEKLTYNTNPNYFHRYSRSIKTNLRNK